MRIECESAAFHEIGCWIEDSRIERIDAWERHLPKVERKDRVGVAFLHRTGKSGVKYTVTIMFYETGRKKKNDR